MKRITFILDGTVQIFRLGKTTNAKISKGNENIVQSYTYSIEQLNYVKNAIETGEKLSMQKFYSLDAKNCFDCPFSANSGDGSCYTHKFGQYRGFIGMLKSIVREFNGISNIPTYNDAIGQQIVSMTAERYVRFGSYGEPSLHPIQLVKSIATVAKSWTGYTHQWFKKPEYASFFMASVHNAKQAETAKEKFNYRSFVVASEKQNTMIHCPASKEQGYKSNCADCGLCSGILGKGNKSIAIIEH